MPVLSLKIELLAAGAPDFPAAANRCSGRGTNDSPSPRCPVMAIDTNPAFVDALRQSGLLGLDQLQELNPPARSLATLTPKRLPPN